MTGARIIVDLGAYRRNLDRIRTRVAPASVMAVVKADGYGHGLLPLAEAAVAAGIEWIGTLDIATALELRAAGIHRDVAIFAWLLGPHEDYAAAVSGGVDLGASTVDQLEQIAAAAASTSLGKARVHLKIDTGLHRNGADVADWPGLISRAVDLAENIDLVGAWTHIAEASDAADTAAIEKFVAALEVAGALGARFEVRHLAASAAAFTRSDARFDLVRIGAFGYGIAPGAGVTPASLGLEPAMTVTAPVVTVIAETATIAIGFADGIPSYAAGLVSVAINGERCVVDSIGAESLTVRLGQRSASIGDTATLFGTGSAGEATVQEWADRLGTVGEELVTRLAPHITREYLGR